MRGRAPRAGMKNRRRAVARRLSNGCRARIFRMSGDACEAVVRNPGFCRFGQDVRDVFYLKRERAAGNIDHRVVALAKRHSQNYVY